MTTTREPTLAPVSPSGCEAPALRDRSRPKFPRGRPIKNATTRGHAPTEAPSGESGVQLRARRAVVRVSGARSRASRSKRGFEPEAHYLRVRADMPTQRTRSGQVRACSHVPQHPKRPPGPARNAPMALELADAVDGTLTFAGRRTAGRSTSWPARIVRRTPSIMVQRSSLPRRQRSATLNEVRCERSDPHRERPHMSQEAHSALALSRETRLSGRNPLLTSQSRPCGQTEHDPAQFERRPV